jgi:hypothetical protein
MSLFRLLGFEAIDLIWAAVQKGQETMFYTKHIKIGPSYFKLPQ